MWLTSMIFFLKSLAKASLDSMSVMSHYLFSRVFFLPSGFFWFFFTKHKLHFIPDDCLLRLQLLSQFKSECIHYTWNSPRSAVATANTSSLDLQQSASRMTPVRIAKRPQIQIKPRNYIPKIVVIIKDISTHSCCTYSIQQSQETQHKLNDIKHNY